jgi:hypothetical protein
MDNVLAAPQNPFEKLRHNLKLFIPAMVLFAGLLGFNLWRLYAASTPEYLGNGIPVHPEIEERFGVRFTGVYVVARGGMIDLRYRVLDAGKAKNFGHFTETSPMLIAEDSGKTIEVTIMMLHNHRVEGGRVYYILFRTYRKRHQAGQQDHYSTGRHHPRSGYCPITQRREK